mmetsp:Transcript_13109/g.19795  ORF Transcript_13109/g.19795 Transcript_13109/m.19795 type:complete len:196 (-) Transcript_13109:1228-1815(-)
MHTDLRYFRSPPGLQLLHCQRFDQEIQGGETGFIDGFQVAERFRQVHPQQFNVLTKYKHTFQKIDQFRHFYYRRPLIDLNSYDQITGVHFSPQFEGPLVLNEQDEITVEQYYAAYALFAQFIRQEKAAFKRFVEGDLVIFNNLRVLHSRKSFVQTENTLRHLQGTYIDIEEFCNIYQQPQWNTTAPTNGLTSYDW